MGNLFAPPESTPEPVPEPEPEPESESEPEYKPPPMNRAEEFVHRELHVQQKLKKAARGVYT